MPRNDGPGGRKAPEGIAEEQRAKLPQHIVKLLAASDMDGEAQLGLLTSTFERLPDGDPLKARISDVLRRMAKTIYLPGFNGTFSPDNAVIRAEPDLDSDDTLVRDWLDALVACRNRII